MTYLPVAGAWLLLGSFFQLPAAPPMKLGLWESTTSMTMNVPGMPGGQRPPTMVHARSCVTAETWARTFTDSGRAGDCTRSNEKFVDGHLTFDMACPRIGGTGHGDMRFANGSGHGTVHLDMNLGGHPVSSEMVIDSHFVDADCGSVVPGKPEIVK